MVKECQQSPNKAGRLRPQGLEFEMPKNDKALLIFFLIKFINWIIIWKFKFHQLKLMGVT
jgi:hypothetical protein